MDHSPQFLKIVEDARKRVKEIGVPEALARHKAGKPMLLIDVREDHEWEKGRIPGAQHLGRGILERDIEKAVPDPGTEIILYCGGGFRSALSADNLQKMGYRKVLSMWGGFRGWLDAKGPVET